MVADEAIPQTDGMPTVSGVGFFYLALEKILADHAGTANSLGIPHVEYTHGSTFSSRFFVMRLSNYLSFSAFLIFFSAFFSFGVLAGSFLTAFLVFSPLLMIFSPYHIRL
jgi:hypothetical protein